MLHIPAKRHSAFIRLITNRRMQPKQLPHPCTTRTPSINSLLASTKMPDQKLNPLAGRELATRALMLLRIHVIRAYARAPLRAYVLEAIHCLAQLHIQTLLLPMPPRLLLPLHHITKQNRVDHCYFKKIRTPSLQQTRYDYIPVQLHR